MYVLFKRWIIVLWLKKPLMKNQSMLLNFGVFFKLFFNVANDTVLFMAAPTKTNFAFSKFASVFFKEIKDRCCSSSFLRYGTFLTSANPIKFSLHQLERLEIGRRS